ncbi:hypothetical protein K5X82_00390 [Halosquirtibacter xylanolyticus]|uniref:hypothetical protein n=1 Tax=Halosquirtibacter xylanolyticus TaxID=3374599 RepID=UPI003747FD20|nr:hypothetical protein K5X82_00390 [Prolixibacteraceae bacterium]
MKLNQFKLLWLVSAIVLFFSCKKEEVQIIPQISLETTETTIAENATSALVVTVKSNITVNTPLEVKLQVSGTAIAGVNYQTLPESVVIPANQSSVKLFVNPINVSTIEANKVVKIEVAPSAIYQIGTPTAVEITIEDNQTPASDAPEVSFATTSVLTNLYLEEEHVISVGLSKSLASDITIPFEISGTLVEGTDYVVEGITANQITIPAGNVSANFTVHFKNNSVVGMDKSSVISFAAPVVTDYAIKASDNKLTLRAVDPQVDFSSWFNDANQFDYLYASWNTSDTKYIVDADAYFLKRYYYNSSTSGWSTLSGETYLHVSGRDSNQFEEVVNQFKKELGGKGIDIQEQERYEYQCGDLLGLARFFSNEATYQKAPFRSTKGWFRFASKDARSPEGAVIIPQQTLKVYTLKEGVDWKAKTTVDHNGSTESHYFWYEDSRNTVGNIENSTNVNTVLVEVERSVGTYNTATKEIIVDVKFTCADAGLNIDPKYYIEKDGDTYTIRIKYINRY